jgi:poly(ADP-ribose) glycohydrolase ARH3
MTAAVATSLARFPDFNVADLAAELVRLATPQRGYGQATLAAIERMREGVPWQSAASVPGGRTSFGNGAAVRSAPIGVFHAGDAESLRWVAEESAAVTHENALAIEGAVLHAFAVGLAAATARRTADGAGFLLSVGAESQMREFRSRYEAAARMLERDFDPIRVVDKLGHGRIALGSVVTAAYCFARHPDDFERAVATALALGGNSTAIASMTGAIAGARVGHAGMPGRWIDGLERGAISPERLRGLASDLHHAADQTP